MSSKVSSFIMQKFKFIGSKTRISQMHKQGNVQNAYMYKNPRQNIFQAKHNFRIDDHKKLDRKCDTMQKSSYFLDHFSN